MVDPDLIAEFLSPLVDFDAKKFVLSLQIVELLHSNLVTVLKSLDFSFVSIHLSSSRPNFSKFLLLLSELLSEFFLLILQYHQMPNKKKRYVLWLEFNNVSLDKTYFFSCS